MKYYVSAFVVFLLAGGILSAQQTAGTPGVISYQGSVGSSDGTPLVDGEYQITVTLYADAQGAIRIWQDTYTTSIRSGIFNIYLGSGAIPLPAPAQMDKALWIGTRISGGEELRPLTRLSASPYAINVPDRAITTSKLADSAVTEEKVRMDYISGVSVNGKKVPISGKVLNIQAGKDIDIHYDEFTQSLIIGSPAGAGTEGENGKETGRRLQGAPLDAWVMGGDGAVIPGAVFSPAAAADFIGTNGAVPFTVKVNAQRVMVFQPNGGLTPSIIGGHVSNFSAAAGNGNTIAGGGGPALSNTIDGIQYNVISGGADNHIFNVNASFGVVAGGQQNTIGTAAILANYGTIGGGLANTVTATYGTIGGGHAHSVTAVNSTVGGGIGNSVSGSEATIAGGDGNQMSAPDASIGGGYHHVITSGANYGTIAGGSINHLEGEYGAIGGGGNQSILNASSVNGTIGGGDHNAIGTAAAPATYATISGGQQNLITGNYGFVGGGQTNNISGPWGVISGGLSNSVNNAGSSFGAIGGGQLNTIGAATALANYGTIGGGLQNTVTATYGTIGGGHAHSVTAVNSTVGGGIGNSVSGSEATIAGGDGNQLTTQDAAIGGGYHNRINGAGISATIPGGENLTAQSYGQTVTGVLNIPKGAMVPGGVPNDDPIFVVGNGIQGVQSNAFEVSYNGHSTVFQNTGGATPVVYGGTYADNVTLAWGNVNGAGGRICDFGVANVTHVGPGWYQIDLSVVDPNGVPLLLNCGSVTATVSNLDPPGSGNFRCAVINVSQIQSSRFDVYISNTGCGPVDEGFNFKVTGRP
ncbi:MAG TPA: hypothetical protein VHI13_17890 [Candidatus Kapabacteria bacterium]|nr:hypothetical protein [Candidatus Kapabacteria bacterium]